MIRKVSIAAMRTPKSLVIVSEETNWVSCSFYHNSFCSFCSNSIHSFVLDPESNLSMITRSGFKSSHDHGPECNVQLMAQLANGACFVRVCVFVCMLEADPFEAS